MERIATFDKLGRFYTKEHIGSLLVSQIDQLAPIRVLDLGAGDGSLSRAARHRWATSDILTVDVDASSAAKLAKLFGHSHSSQHKHIRADALRHDLPELIRVHAGPVDAAVCNPPFLKPKWRKGFAEILEEAGFSSCLPILREADAALLFLAQNLRLLTSTGTLGIVLPDSLVSAKKYRAFREQLISRYHLIRTVRLPRRSFVNTDALAYIVVVGKGTSTTDSIQLQSFDTGGGICGERLVNAEEAVTRLDFAYHSQTRTSDARTVPLGDLCLRVVRGSLTTTQRLEVHGEVLHLTDFRGRPAGSLIAIPQSLTHPNFARMVTASKNDILMARVGKKLEEQIYLVAEGTAAITDCLYVLSVPSKYRSIVLQQLCSEAGRQWLASRAYGVGARHLAKIDLLNFPIQL